MTSRLTLSVPATLTVLGGDASLSSLAGISLGGAGPGISLSGAGAADTVSLQIVAGYAGASFAVGNADGASYLANANTLSLNGTQAQLNLALASLVLSEPAGVTSDVLSLTATDTAAVAVASGFAVNVADPTGPAFVAPPQSMTLQSNSLSTLSGLLLSDPIAAGLAGMGLGQEETLSLTLAVAQGVLLLPGMSNLSGVTAIGLGSGTITLACNAGEIGELNTLLAGLAFAGPAGGQELQYALWNAAGVLPRTVTYGQIFLDTTGTAAADGVFTLGLQTLITGGTMFNGTLYVNGIETVLGDLAGGTIEVAPAAVLQVPDGNMSLTGTSGDFGTISAQQLTLAGTIFIGGTASFAGEVAVLPGALIDIADGLTVYGTANNSFDVGLSMAAGAVLEGNGTVTVGNFSQAGVVDGGTIIAPAGDTLQLDAGWITSNATLYAAGGGVMVLGPVAPLYGVFNTTPLTIDASVVLSFLSTGPQAVTGGYADTLGGTGGAFVIAGPQDFSGNITNFGLGDQLIFPDLAGLSIYNVGTASFNIAGIDMLGNTDTYTIHTSIAAGLAPAVALDAQGDEEVVMRPAGAVVTQGAALAATPGVAQPLLGVAIDLPGGTTQSLVLTLTAAHGSLSSAGSAAASRITLTAASATALNAEIAAVSYSGTGVADSILFSGNSGLLDGALGGVIIGAGGGGTVSGYDVSAATGAQMVSFGLALGLPAIIQPLATGGVEVNGNVDFEDILRTRGYGGTALLVDGGGEAILGAAAVVSLAGDVTLGDASGAGTLMVLTENFTAAGNVTLAAGSAAAVLGAMDVAGTLDIGLNAAAALLVQGSFGAGVYTSIGTGGSLTALGTAQLSFGTLNNNGTLGLSGGAIANVASYTGNGAVDLGGTSSLVIAGLAVVTGAAPGLVISVSTGAVLSANAFQGLGSSIADAGLITAAVSLDAGSGTLLGGTLAAPEIVIGGTLTGYGVIAAPSIDTAGLVEAQGGRLLLSGNVNDSALLEIAAGATLEIGGTIGNAPVYFAGADAVLVLDDATVWDFGVAQMQPGDVVDLVGIAPGLVSIPASGGGAGYILTSQGSVAVQFGIGELGTLAPNVSVVSDGNGGSLLTIGGVLPCFARGTGILGPHGYRPVESLRPNDPVITANGERRPVRWIGWRTLDLAGEGARQARPVLIMPHAFGRGRPGKMLRLSPSHCIHAGGVLIPVTHLVNNATILRETAVQAATYYHVELDRHDILLAEGLECESYFDDGNRAIMTHELGRRAPARRAYAPVVTGGARLAAVRRMLHEIALKAGFATRYHPQLRAIGAGHSAVPEILPAGPGRLARFCFPQAVRALVLLSATACPADTDPASQDRRELGICLGEMQGARLGRGWHARGPGDIGTWMGASAGLALPRARREVVLPLAAIAPSWARLPVPQAVDVSECGG